jgi:dihydropteroate synthase
MHCEQGFASAHGDTIGMIKRFFERSLEIAAKAGVPENRLILDPGIGFHKTQPQNLEILARVSELGSFGLPLLLGASRKSVIGRVLGGTPEDRLEGTLATTVLAVSQGVEFVRVHDVLANVRAARMAEAVLGRA